MLKSAVGLWLGNHFAKEQVGKGIADGEGDNCAEHLKPKQEHRQGLLVHWAKQLENEVDEGEVVAFNHFFLTLFLDDGHVDQPQCLQDRKGQRSKGLQLRLREVSKRHRDCIRVLGILGQAMSGAGH